MIELLRKISWIGFVVSILFFTGCSDNDDATEDFSNVPGVENQTWSATIVCNPQGETLNFSFAAHASWTVKSDGNWYQVSPTSGVKGNSNIQVTVNKNTTNASRSAEIIVYVQGYKSSSFTITQDKSGETEATGETEMNTEIDEYLAKYYLWNDEYQSMTRDLTIPYKDSYDNFMRNTLLEMTTNTLDKKQSSTSGNYILYSYIDRKEKSVQSKSALTAGVNHGVEKEAKISSYGFSKLGLVGFVDSSGNSTGEYGLVVESVYPSSSANSFNVKRGSIIYEVDSKSITESNYMSVYLELLNPTASSVKLLTGNGKDEPEEVFLQATEIDPTPIILNKVIEIEGHKVGYLVYESFDAAYDDDMLAVLADFKSKGISDLVLDLRYNGGGHVISCMMLSGCIVGSSCKDKVFQYYRYNDTRMANVSGTKTYTGNDYDATAKYFYDNFVYTNYYGVNLNSYALNQTRLYVLTTASTASASEVLINSLRGIDMDVIVIGENTNGKNVGMEVHEFDLSGYTYELAPITFQYYNAKKKTVPESGLKVDYEVADWDKYDGYGDFGELTEPMLAKALELITGTSTTIAKSRSVSTMRVKELSIELPTIHRTQGTIIIHPSSVK